MTISRAWTRFWAIPHALKVLLLIVLVCIAVPAFAEEYMVRIGADSVRISDKPCLIVDVIADRVPEGARGYLRLAYAHFSGQDYRGCWAADSRGVVHLWYEDGDEGALPASLFKPAPEA